MTSIFALAVCTGIASASCFILPNSPISNTLAECEDYRKLHNQMFENYRAVGATSAPKYYCMEKQIPAWMPVVK